LGKRIQADGLRVLQDMGAIQSDQNDGHGKTEGRRGVLHALGAELSPRKLLYLRLLAAHFSPASNGGYRSSMKLTTYPE
jgi:hypothetical protein